MRALLDTVNARLDKITPPNNAVPVTITLTPNLQSEMQNVSGVSTTNSTCATASAASGLRQLANTHLSSASVSGSLDPNSADLDLSEFPTANITDPMHHSSFNNDDPYSLDVDLGDIGVSFANLTERYPSVLQDQVPPPPVATAQAQLQPVALLDEVDDTPTVGNPFI